MSKRAWVAAAVAAAVAVVGGATAAVWSSSSGEDAADVGELVELDVAVATGGADIAPAREIEFRVPGGVVVVAVGERVDELPADGDVLRAAGGAALVPVTWTLDPVPAPLVAPRVDLDEVSDLLDLSVRAGDRLTQLPAGASGTGAALVVADDDDVLIELAFDGVVQTADVADGVVDPGVAEPLYAADPAATPLPGPVASVPLTGRLPSGFAIDDATATVQAVDATPWLPDRGWVEERGQVWWCAEVVVVAPPTVVRDFGQDGRFDRPAEKLDYRLDLQDSALLLDDDAAVQPLEVERPTIGNYVGDGVVVWLADTEPSGLVVRMGFTVVPDRGRSTEEITLAAAIDVSHVPG